MIQVIDHMIFQMIEVDLRFADHLAFDRDAPLMN